jgi:hypothetical protein
MSINTQIIGQEVMLTPIESELQLTPVRESVSTIDEHGEALMLVENVSEDNLKIPNNALVAKVAKIHEQKVHWANEAIQQKLKDLLPNHIKVRKENLMIIEQPEEKEEINIHYIHDKEKGKTS